MTSLSLSELRLGKFGYVHIIAPCQGNSYEDFAWLFIGFLEEKQVTLCQMSPSQGAAGHEASVSKFTQREVPSKWGSGGASIPPKKENKLADKALQNPIKRNLHVNHHTVILELD